jgi:hypothetical protein
MRGRLTLIWDGVGVDSSHGSSHDPTLLDSCGLSWTQRPGVVILPLGGIPLARTAGRSSLLAATRPPSTTERR